MCWRFLRSTKDHRIAEKIRALRIRLAIFMAMTKHAFGASGPTSKGSGHPVMFGNPQPVQDFGPFPDGGGYPIGFLPFVYREMARVVGKTVDPATVLHLCSGSMLTGVRVDVRPEMNPDIVADCRKVPLPDESFDFILSDPPYSEEYARDLYGTASNYPRPGQIANEACRLLKPGGVFGLLHFQVPMIHKPLEMVGVFGVTTGAGYAIRAWTLCYKSAQVRLLP
jgi:SAM-dependent methyltransferase